MEREVFEDQHLLMTAKISQHKAQNGVIKKEMALKENKKMALIKMALTIRVDGAQAQSGGR